MELSIFKEGKLDFGCFSAVFAMEEGDYSAKL